MIGLITLAGREFSRALIAEAFDGLKCLGDKVFGRLGLGHFFKQI